jgi:NhaA family Na+:H+ antiporter
LGEVAGRPLLVAAVLAVVWASVPGGTYSAIWQHELTVSLAGATRSEPLNRWVTDALLPLFFLVAGLEIKREFVHGELDTWRRAALPLIVAVGGGLVPLSCYLAITWGRQTIEGWAIPVATDIAFALAVLAVLGDRVPRSVKVFTLAFAAIDDIIGTLIIALFYTTELSVPALGFAAGFLLMILGCRAVSVRGELIYWLLGAGFVASVLQAGIHSAVAGLALGLLAPSRPLFSRQDLVGRLEAVSRQIAALDEALTKLERDRASSAHNADGDHEYEDLLARQESYLAELEELTVGYEAPVDRELRRVTPWVSYLILPIFALANAGVAVSIDALRSVFVTGPGLAIVVGLVAGKPVGITLFAWLALRTGLAQLPPGLGWRHLTVVALLAGIGFTVSLFIAQLSFPMDETMLDRAKLAVLTGSAVAMLLGGGAGYLLLPKAATDGA